MWSKLGLSILALGAAVSSAGACAMIAPEHNAHSNCRVIGGEKLPPATGGADAVCAKIEKAIAERAPNVRYSAEVRVLSKSALAANLVADGRKIPQQNFAVSDRDLSASSVERFARALAEEIAKAAKA